MVYNWINYTQNLLFPSRCLCCGDSCTGSLDLCDSCARDLPWNHHSCSRCARVLPANTAPNSLCGQCLNHAPAFNQIHAPLLYQAPTDQLIKRLKFAHQLPVGKLLGALLADYLKDQNYQAPEILLPVPLHPKQLKKRSFNQAAEITRQVAKHLDIPWSAGHLHKIKESQDQIGLNKKQRIKNLRGCFQFQNGNFRHVAIVDDVVTTGTTANEIARALKKEGVERVDILAVARTP